MMGIEYYLVIRGVALKVRARKEPVWVRVERAFQTYRDPKMKVTLAKVPWEDDRTRTTERAKQG